MSGFEQGVLETLKRCEERNESTMVWAMEVAKCIRSWGVGVPSPELGQLLVSHLCFDNNHSSLWKFIEQALSSGLLYPLQLLSLLTSRYHLPLFYLNNSFLEIKIQIQMYFRVIPNRGSQPKAYRLYLELLSRYAFSFNPIRADGSKEK